MLNVLSFKLKEEERVEKLGTTLPSFASLTTKNILVPLHSGHLSHFI